MRTTGDFLSGPRSAPYAATLLIVLALSGCGGGGGGSPGTPDSGMPIPFAYPTSLSTATSTDDVEGFMSPYAFNPTAFNLVSETPAVSGTVANNGSLTITVDSITLPSSTVEPAFVVTFDPNSISSSPVSDSISPLAVVGCSGCLKTVSVDATYVSNNQPAGKVTFTYLDPGASAFLLKYSVLGMWTKPTLDPIWSEVGGAFSAGVITRGFDLPTTGSANYQGYFVGRYATTVPVSADTQGNNPGYSAGSYLVGANATAFANFNTQIVTFSTSNTHIAPDSGGAPFQETRLNLTSTPMPIVGTGVSTTNTFGGTVTTTSNLSGPIQGAFYGPTGTTATSPPPELGGSVAVTNNTNQSMVGSFGLKTP